MQPTSEPRQHAPSPSAVSPSLLTGAALTGAAALVVSLLGAPAWAAALAAAGTAGLSGTVIAGRLQARSERALSQAQAQNARLREAIASQALVDPGELPRIEAALQRALRSQHGLSNAVMSASLNMDMLLGALRGREVVAGDTLDLAESVRDGLGRVKRMAGELKQVAQVEPAPEATRVEVGALVEGVLAEARRAHPAVQLALEAAPHVPDAVLVRGGAQTVRALVLRLVDNAAQGDGTRGAQRVTVRTGIDSSGQQLTLEVVDDGPGFPPGQLAQPPQPFATTKAGALGLGLYVCDRLARASRGVLARENAAAGGACVRVLLPLDVPPPPAGESEAA